MIPPRAVFGRRWAGSHAKEHPLSTTDAARAAAISLRQAIDMQTPKALELWLDVIDERVERAHQVTGLSSKDRRRLGELLDPQTAVELFDTIDAPLSAK